MFNINAICSGSNFSSWLWTLKIATGLKIIRVQCVTSRMRCTWLPLYSKIVESFHNFRPWCFGWFCFLRWYQWNWLTIKWQHYWRNLTRHNNNLTHSHNCAQTCTNTLAHTHTLTIMITLTLTQVRAIGGTTLTLSSSSFEHTGIVAISIIGKKNRENKSTIFLHFHFGTCSIV